MVHLQCSYSRVLVVCFTLYWPSVLPSPASFVSGVYLKSKNHFYFLHLKEEAYPQYLAELPQLPTISNSMLQYKLSNLQEFIKDFPETPQSHFIYLIRKRSNQNFQDEITKQERRGSEGKEIIFKVNKRNPSCIRKCLSRKILHPAQCHFVC